MHNRKRLNMDPPYQRRSVWNQEYKESFVDTVLLEYPSPAIFLFEEMATTGLATYHVVDGKQRLTAIFEFIEGLYSVSNASEAMSLRGKYFDQLSVDEKTSFWTYDFSVEYLPTNDESLINSVFQRINKNTAKLTRQELRHARFDGRFIRATEELSEWMNGILPPGFPRIDGQSRKQMKDVELVANLLLFLEVGANGYSQDDLDAAFSDRDTAWDRETEMNAEFRKVIEAIRQIVAANAASNLERSRLRNQADFYSFFGAVASLLKRGELPNPSDCNQCLTKFIETVDDPVGRLSILIADQYFRSARSNSNDTAPRRTRIEILEKVMAPSSGSTPAMNTPACNG